MVLICSLAAFLSGMCLSLQGPTNAALARRSDRFSASFISSLVGLLLSLLWMMLAGKGDLSLLPQCRFWMYLGGVYWVYRLFLTMIGIQYLGLALTVTLTMLGQMATSFVIDIFGAFGVTAVPVSMLRLGGICAVALGILLIDIGNRRSSTASSAPDSRHSLLLVVPVFGVGVGSSLRVPASAAMSAIIGSHEATFISFVIGTALTFAAALIINRGRLIFPKKNQSRPWFYLGGLYGVIAQFLNIISVPALGVTLQSACGMFGRLICSVFTDHFGLLETKKAKISAWRLSGILSIALGVCLVTVAKLGYG